MAVELKINKNHCIALKPKKQKVDNNCLLKSDKFREFDHILVNISICIRFGVC